FAGNGQEMMGVCIAWDAAKKFEAETGAPSTSAAQFIANLKNDRLHLTPNTVVVLDEAAMAGSKTIHAVVAAVDKAGGKTILMGDHKQLQPIEAGGTFRLVGSAIGSARLSDIRRQKSEYDLATAKAFYKDARQAYERMEKAGQISECADSKAAIAALVGDYARSSSPLSERLVLVGTHKEARTVSNHIREVMKANGTIRGKEHTFCCKTGRWEESIHLACGDRIRFTKKSKELGVVNGSKATVERIDGTIVHCKLESDIAAQNGRRMAFDITKTNTVNYDWAVTVHKSQGQSKAEVFQLANPQMSDYHSSMVGFTRMKQKFHLYGASEDIATFKRRVGVERLKENAVDSLITPTPPQKTAKQQVVDLIARVKAAFRPVQQQPEPTQQKVRQRSQEIER
ncbi:TPA: AAA family ATPase, partial [Stenotrophomonas maltophilia]